MMAFTAKHQNFGYLVRIMANIIVNDVNHYVHNKCNSASSKSIIFHSEYSKKQARNIVISIISSFSFLSFLVFWFFVVISGDHILNTD